MMNESKNEKPMVRNFEQELFADWVQKKKTKMI